MKYGSSIEALQNEASSQWGLFTAARAQRIGVSRKQLNRMVNDGRIEQLCYGTYRFTIGEETPSVAIKAAWLSSFPKEPAWERAKKDMPDAVVAGRTATVLHDAGDFYATPYTFIIEKGKRTARKDIQFLPWKIEKQDIVFIDDLPTTSVERTIADLIRLHEDMSLVEDFMRQIGAQRTSIDHERLSHLLAPLAARNGFARNDGTSFADDLIKRNMLDIQVSNILESLEKTLEPFRERSQMINDLIAKSPAIVQLQQTLASAAFQETLSNLREIVGKNTLPEETRRLLTEASTAFAKRSIDTKDKDS